MNIPHLQIKSVSALELAKLQKENQDFFLLDVREQDEFDLCKINGAVLCPLSDFENNLAALNLKPEQKIIIYCHHGKRSLAAYMFMSQRGFTNLLNLDGGIDAWSEEVDSSVIKY